MRPSPWPSAAPGCCCCCCCWPGGGGVAGSAAGGATAAAWSDDGVLSITLMCNAGEEPAWMVWARACVPIARVATRAHMEGACAHGGHPPAACPAAHAQQLGAAITSMRGGVQAGRASTQPSAAQRPQGRACWCGAVLPTS